MNTYPISPKRYLTEQAAKSLCPRQGQSAAHKAAEREQIDADRISRSEVKRLQRFATGYGASLEDFGPGLASFPHLKRLQEISAGVAKQARLDAGRERAGSAGARRQA